MSIKKGYFVPLLMIGLLFGVFGFAAWLNSILIPYFQITLELNSVQTTLVTFSFFIAYVVMALPSSWVLRKIGFKIGIVLGLVIMALGALLFIPAAHTRTYSISARCNRLLSVAGERRICVRVRVEACSCPTRSR